MKRQSKEIKGVSTASIVGLKALLSQEKAARAGKATSTPLPAPPPPKDNNKGVADRARKDELPEENIPKPKKITYIGGVAYTQGDDDWEPLVDTERKRWEEYERSEFSEARAIPAKHSAWFDQSRKEEEKEALQRSERRELLSELAQDTERGREEYRAQIAKRNRDKMARLELIKSKSQKTRAMENSSDNNRSSIETRDEKMDEKGKESKDGPSATKKAKLVEEQVPIS